jgi:hypothetical protein
MYLLLAKTHRNSLDNPPIFYVSEWTNAFAVGLHRWVDLQIRRHREPTGHRGHRTLDHRGSMLLEFTPVRDKI